MVQLLFFPPVYADNIEDDRFTDISVAREGQVLIVELASPPINGISVPVLTGINAVLDIALDTDAVKAIVITGQETLFSTGAGEISDGPAGLSHSE